MLDLRSSMLDAGYSIARDKHRCKLVIEDQKTRIEHQVSDRILDKENYYPARPLFQIKKSETA
jgi:hypothetical protein